MKSFYGILVAIALAGVALMAFLASDRGGSAIVVLPAGLEPGTASGYVMGSPDAKVEITEFGDFECGGCGYFASVTEPDVRKMLVTPGLARFRFVDFPLEGHAHAMSAHVAATCADEQSKFWEMHDKIFEGQGEWSYGATKNPKKLFEGYARAISLDYDEWNTCYEARSPLPRIMANREEGVKLGVRGTPTVFVNNIKLGEKTSYDVIKGLVDSLNLVLGKAAPTKTDTGKAATATKAGGGKSGGE